MRFSHADYDLALAGKRIARVRRQHVVQHDDVSRLPAKVDSNFPVGFANGVYYGIFEDNDPTKRLLVIANRDNDLGEYWEFSDTGYAPVDLSNEAYKLGVNYLVYGMTH